MPGHTQKVVSASREAANNAILEACELAEKYNLIDQMIFWMALSDLIDSRFPRQFENVNARARLRKF